VLALKDDEIVPVDRGAQFSPFRWDNRDGRITLAGDAAHAMLPRKAVPVQIPSELTMR
jgi:2-polyprenyl-6-methoxyphenol hydroxylase-like FAD-dependent oxidoreductase